MTNPIQDSQQNLKPKLSEKDLKRAVSDYLTYQQNAGKLMFLRLNAGSFILSAPDGSFRRRVQGAKKGTSDFLVTKPGHLTYNPQLCRVFDIELKSDKGRQSEAQKEYQKMAESQGHIYCLVRSVEELEDILQL